jgi:hypothetical protein
MFDFKGFQCFIDFMRFIGVLLGLTLVTSLTYGIIYFWGKGRTYPAYTNEFLNQKKPWVFVPENLSPLEEEIPWVEVEQDAQGILQVVSSKLPFPEWLEKNKPKFMAIHVLNSKAEIHEQISSFLPKLWDEKVFIQSEIDVVLAALKEIRPRWAYGSSVADRVRWKSFDSLGLVSAVTHTRDVYVTSLSDRNGENLSDSIVDEIRKRKLFLVIGPLKTAEEVQLAQHFKPDGYIILNTDLRAQIH